MPTNARMAASSAWKSFVGVPTALIGHELLIDPLCQKRRHCVGPEGPKSISAASPSRRSVCPITLVWARRYSSMFTGMEMCIACRCGGEGAVVVSAGTARRRKREACRSAPASTLVLRLTALSQPPSHNPPLYRVHSRPAIKRTGENGDSVLLAPNLPPACLLWPRGTSGHSSQSTTDAQEVLVGASLLYRWPSVGWCVGVIKEANGDRRFKIDGKVVNFHVHYEIDDDTSNARSMCSPRSMSMAVRASARGCSSRRRCERNVRDRTEGGHRRWGPPGQPYLLGPPWPTPQSVLLT